MILAAGLGTRLKPWTERHPKALVPVGGIPMLQRVIDNITHQGIERIVVNIHHFGEQIIEFLKSNDFGVEIQISDERGTLLDTGGGLLHAKDLLCTDNSPILIHNVDILSNADLRTLMATHIKSDADATLLVSNRTSSRKLIFTDDLTLKGWHNLSTDEFRPDNIRVDCNDTELAFSGIHIINPSCISEMIRKGYSGKFPIMDFYLQQAENFIFKGYNDSNLQLIDIGKPDTLAQAESLF